MLEEKKIREISQKVNAIGKENIDYISIYHCTQMLLDAVFGKNSIFEENTGNRAIINISKILEEIGMVVFEQPINFNNKNFILGTIIKRCNRVTGEEQINCLVEVNMRWGHTRITIAVLVYYYLKYYEETRIAKSVTLPLNMYKTMEEMIAITFARMLLMPPLIIKREFSEIYKGEKLGRIELDGNWYCYLSNLTGLQKEDAIIGWQEIRVVLKLLDLQETEKRET